MTPEGEIVDMDALVEIHHRELDRMRKMNRRERRAWAARKRKERRKERRKARLGGAS